MQVNEKNGTKLNVGLIKPGLTEVVQRMNKLYTLLMKFKYWRGVRFLAGLGVFYLLVSKLVSSSEFSDSYATLLHAIDTTSVALLVLLVLLIPINWLIEAKKWQILIRPQERIGLFQSFKTVLSGLGLGLVAPFGLGDYLGRISVISKKETIKYAFGATMLNGFFQLIPTILFGLLSTFFLVSAGTQSVVFLQIGGLALLLVIVILILKRNYVYAKISEWLPQKLVVFLSALERTGLRNCVLVIGQSFLRYGVFAFQFYLAFLILKIDLPNHLIILGVFWIFLIKSLVPKLSELSDGAVRALSASFFFAQYGFEDPMIVLATILIWVLNVIIPGLLGAYFIGTTRLT